MLRHAEEWAAVGAAFKGFDDDHPSVGGEEWLGGPYPTVAWMSDTIATLEALRVGADPLAGLPVHTREDGQVVLRVMPGSVYDRLLLSGYDLDVWMEPGVSEASMRAGVGAFYRQPDPPGRVTCVLGAGNVSAIPVLDVLYAMFVAGDVVALKLNPIGEAYGPVFEKFFAPLVRDGYLRLVYGGGDVGAHLVRSDLVQAVHITGSARTFDAIVWGSGPEAQARKRQGTPLLDKPITSELGGVGPTIVVPGDWSKADIEFQAQHVATQKLHSSGHTCVASQVLVLPAAWPQREQFVDAVRRALARAPHRRPFYPGTREKVQGFVDTHGARRLDSGQQVALLEDIDPTSDHPAFAEELFGPMYVTTSLPGETPEEFLRNAVDFANTRLMGDLGANLLVDPATESTHQDSLDQAVADLRFGCIGINAWAGVVFLTSRAAWGAYAGNTADDHRIRIRRRAQLPHARPAAEERAARAVPPLPPIGAPRRRDDGRQTSVVPGEPDLGEHRAAVHPFRRRPQAVTSTVALRLRVARLRHARRRHDGSRPLVGPDLAAHGPAEQPDVRARVAVVRAAARLGRRRSSAGRAARRPLPRLRAALAPGGRHVDVAGRPRLLDAPPHPSHHAG